MPLSHPPSISASPNSISPPKKPESPQSSTAPEMSPNSPVLTGKREGLCVMSPALFSSNFKEIRFFPTERVIFETRPWDTSEWRVSRASGFVEGFSTPPKSTPCPMQPFKPRCRDGADLQSRIKANITHEPCSVLGRTLGCRILISPGMQRGPGQRGRAGAPSHRPERICPAWSWQKAAACSSWPWGWLQASGGKKRGGPILLSRASASPQARQAGG